ncbi:MAG: hypothetical protein ABI723_03715 [Bacteroidia bacterium]
MISKPVLRELVTHRLRDAEALFAKKRYRGAIYMSGYAIEIALKYKICKLYLFSKGFPENKVEFQSYYNVTGIKKQLRQTIKSVQEIKNHDLSKLLFYSGSELRVKSKTLIEWHLIATWNPEMRYANTLIRKSEAQNKLSAVKSLLKEIL